MAEFSALMEQMKQMQLQSTSEEEHRHIQAQIQALIELEQQRLTAEAEERKLEQQRLDAEAEERKVLKGMFTLALQYEKALWNKLMAMDDDDFEAFVDEVNNMPSAERMNELYPLEELPCSHHYLAAKIAKRIDELCADGQWKSSEALMEGLRAGAQTLSRPRLPPQPFPCPFEDLDKWNLKDSYGPNVQVYSIGKQNKEQGKVFKHFDYWGRTANLCSSLSAQCVPYQDRRYPPDDRILTKLSQLDVTGSFYQKWEVVRLATAVDVLSYPYVKPADTVEIEQLVQVIYQLKAIHSVDFVHGDILPRNILFCSDWEGHPAAFLIDFDLGRFLAANPAHNPVYASNFAREGKPLESYRHPYARGDLPMQKEHDGFALARVMEKFLQDDEARQQLVAALEELQLDDAATLCQQCSLLPLDNVAGLGKATGSPRR
ncbi:uncharacterized protein MONBRDRAFT_30582 [Monosiga brevicollis MX1]|uniref:Protein kinase domain-containing protein n=1 Tax=Monosiga brevicollis TaxID=81824 RepID=A9VEC9_MONBE|nr:uncharacterized protein MONBRDRAFT_30582 [Monosiga brevicollis MX1]EDQ84114.1 predicted protein [Monosiga brevicollis MX1]|eukprot:XP_001751077.1 hypothetical protein [Monosiga brevicollis MX1]